MESKHTPGPWQAVGTTSVMDADNNLIAVSFEARNRNLIAAAPDMYGTLAMVKKCLEADLAARATKNLLQLVNATLAIATGGDPIAAIITPPNKTENKCQVAIRRGMARLVNATLATATGNNPIDAIGATPHPETKNQK